MFVHKGKQLQGTLCLFQEHKTGTDFDSFVSTTGATQNHYQFCAPVLDNTVACLCPIPAYCPVLYNSSLVIAASSQSQVAGTGTLVVTETRLTFFKT